MDPAVTLRLVEAYDLADTLRETLSLGDWTHGWCRSSCSGQVRSGSLKTDQLGSLAAVGCRVKVTLDTGRLHISASADRSRNFVIDSTGEFADVADDLPKAEAAADAAAGHNLNRLLDVLPNVDMQVEITVLGTDHELTWAATTLTMVEEYERAGWSAFSSLIAQPVNSTRLVILDVADGEIRAPGLVIHGPGSWPEVDERQGTTDLDAGDESGFRADHPVPSALLPTHASDSLLPIANALRSTAASLVLLWLADTVSGHNGDVTATFHGIRPLQVEITTAPPESADACVDLWEWVADGRHPGRRQAAIQAITMQVETADDFYAQARVIHDTAQFLFAVSQSGLVQEAMAARRGARVAAMAAARSAAERARSSARSAVDRSLVVVGAGIGIVLANRGDLIDLPIAVALLALTSILVVGAGVLAFSLELPGADSSITAFRDDLAYQTEVLTRRDIERLRNLPSLQDAEREIKRARTAVWTIVILTVLAMAILLGALLSGIRGESNTELSSSTFTSATQSSRSRVSDEHLLSESVTVAEYTYR